MDYIIASSKSWNLEILSELKLSESGNWSYVETPDKLQEKLKLITPKYIFFLHWNWLVPEPIWRDIECVCFHMTDVPYGRGGSPLQNLILRGHKRTKLTALRMVGELDAGPVYAKRDLSLSGSAKEIYERASRCSFELIKWLVKEEPKPVKQQGEVVVFERRSPEQSRINKFKDDEALYDFIRMLDAPGYPKAFLDSNGKRLEFSNARWVDGLLTTDVRFKSLSEEVKDV